LVLKGEALRKER
jgi:hypothetical protein